MVDLIFRDRAGTDSKKWDALTETFGCDGLLPMWVADMDIECPDCVRRALTSFAEYNIHGYYRVPDSFYDAFIKWEKERHGYEVDRRWIRFAPGVVPAIYWIIQMLTRQNDVVCIMNPVYYPFANAVRETGRILVWVPLINDHGRYSIDYEAFEAKLIAKDVKLFIMSSPHNPVGRVWTKEELTKIMEICRRRGVFVISDEIHQDIVMPPHRHIPTATVGDYDSILITLTSASKTFNLAGCQNAFVIIPDAPLRSKFDAYVRGIKMQQGNSFGYIASQAAYEEGLPWLEAVTEQIRENYELLCKGLKEQLPGAVVSPLEGSYLAWIDLSTYLEGRDTEQVMRDVCRLAPDYGEWFGGDEYENFVRINLATSPRNVELAVSRLSKIREI